MFSSSKALSMDSKVNRTWFESSVKPPTRLPRLPRLIFSIRTQEELNEFIEAKTPYWNVPPTAILPQVDHFNLSGATHKYELANDTRDENDRYEMDLGPDGSVSLNLNKDWNPPKHAMTEQNRAAAIAFLPKAKTAAQISAEGEGTWIKNPDSWARRRAASMSAEAQAQAAQAAQAVSSTVDQERKPSSVLIPAKVTLNQNMIFKKYEMDELFIRVCEDRMRVWLRNSVVKPLADEIEKLNDAMVREKITPHVKIGHSTLEQIIHALNTSHILHSTVLPYLLPYLRVVANQEYLVSRVHQLAADVAMRDFKWFSGSGTGSGEVTAGGERKPTTWNEQLPTDSELVWLLFCVFMDTQMTPQSLAITDSDIQKPFSHTYTLSKSGRNAPIQKSPQAFYIHMASLSPPHFELYTDGGRTLIECGKGGSNLFKILVLFFRHAQLFNNDSIDQIHLGSGSLNVSRIFSSYL